MHTCMSYIPGYLHMNVLKFNNFYNCDKTHIFQLILGFFLISRSRLNYCNTAAQVTVLYGMKYAQYPTDRLRVKLL